MKIYCPAKINLFLNVLGIDKETNMHKLFLINQTVDLYDEIELLITDNNSITIESSDDIPKDERNSIYKACKLMKDTYKIDRGIKFIVNKHIPIEAGLGGESTDAAGTILLMNKVFDLGLDTNTMSSLGSKIGSDVPFFIHSGFKYVSSTGNEVNNSTFNNPYKYYIIVKPDYGLSTKEMFKKIDDKEVEIISHSKLPYNDFMTVVPESILDIKEYFDSLGLKDHTLSGSGSSYYVALNKKDNKLYNIIKNKYKEYNVYLVKNCDGYKYK